MRNLTLGPPLNSSIPGITPNPQAAGHAGSYEIHRQNVSEGELGAFTQSVYLNRLAEIAALGVVRAAAAQKSSCSRVSTPFTVLIN